MSDASPVAPPVSAPTEPAPTEPAPTEPAPTVPAPTVPAPTVPAPTVPAPTAPAPTVPAPTVPAPTVPAPTVPAPIVDEAPVAAPIFAPASIPSRLTEPPFPTTFGDDKTAPASSSIPKQIETFMLNPYHFVLVVGCGAVIALFVFWKCCKSWKLRREKQMLRLQSTRVDAVLGDMQMVGMDDNDGDDPELI